MATESVLEAPPPRFSARDVATIAAPAALRTPQQQGLSPNGDCPNKRLVGQTPPGSIPAVEERCT
jgi:hypothetical protein